MSKEGGRPGQKVTVETRVGNVGPSLGADTHGWTVNRINEDKEQ